MAMNSNSPLIQAKVLKVDTSLSDLNKEISKCTVYLEKLKQDSENIVGKLNGISMPALYLREFVGVNSFLLKYINLLTEINCKFEVMEILESENGISKCDKKHLNNVCQVFEQPVLTEINSSFEDSLEHVNGCNSNQYSNDKQRFQSKVLEGKVLPDRKFTDHEEKNFCSEFLDVVKSQVHEKCSHEISDQPRVSLKKKLCEPDQRKSNFELSEHNTSKDPANHSEHETDEMKQDKTLSCICQKTEPTVERTSSDSVVQMDRTVKIQSLNAEDEDKDKIPTCIDRENHVNEIRQLEIPQSLGKEFYVNIKHVISPSEFYVHFADRNLNLLPELEEQLNLITIECSKESLTQNKGNECTKSLLCRKIGSYALYYSKVNEMWYRVKVTDWCLNRKDDLVSIFLMDYGESKLVPFESLHSMREHLTKYPAFAQRCHLSGIRPLDINDNEPFKWDAKAKNEMISLLDKAKNIKILIVPNDCYHPPTSLPVLLWRADGHDKCVNKLLVEKKCVKVLDVFDDLRTTEICDNNNQLEKELEKWNPMKEECESHLNSYELNKNNRGAVIYGYVGKDSKRVCPQYARTREFCKGSNCRKKDKFLNSMAYIADEEEVYKDAFNLLTPPSVNSIIRVLVTSIVDVNQFYCIAHYQVENSEESLYTLVDYINENKNVKEMKELLIPPSIGQVVLAKYSQDNCWYRAKVLESEPESDRFSLIFVDYGNKETVPLSRLRAIEPKYLHLPFQGMQCFIYGVGKNPKASQDEVMKYLNKKMMYLDLKIEVVSQFPGDDVSLLVNVFDQNGTDIGKDLIAQKYGVEKEDIILSTDCDKLPG